MKRQALLPLVAYPDPNSEAVAANAAAMAAQLGADLHVLAFNADIPPVSSALSRVLMDVLAMVREAETLSRKHGARLLEAAKREAEKPGIEATCNELAFAPAMLAEMAATHGR